MTNTDCIEWKEYLELGVVGLVADGLARLLLHEFVLRGKLERLIIGFLRKFVSDSLLIVAVHGGVAHLLAGIGASGGLGLVLRISRVELSEVI